MITNERELKATHGRIEQFQRWLVQVRQTANPKEFEALASGNRIEIERMQAEVMEYLLHPPSVPCPPSSVLRPLSGRIALGTHLN